MKLVESICDNCKKHTKSVELKVPMSRDADPSGNGYQTNYAYLDLCPDCIASVLDLAHLTGLIEIRNHAVSGYVFRIR